MHEQLDYTTRPLLGEPWILDVDTTVKPLYGEQEGAVVSYNPAKPGRPSHTYHSYMVANLRLLLEVEVQPGHQHTAKHSTPDLWALLSICACSAGAATGGSFCSAARWTGHWRARNRRRVASSG